MQQPSHDLKMFQSSPVSPRRFISIGVVGALHVLAVYALATGLAAQLLEKPLEELKAEVVRQKPPDNPKEPPPPPPDLAKPPPPFVPPPDIAISTEVQSTNAISQVQTKQEVKVGISAPAAAKSANCASKYYPALAVRLGHEGATIVTVAVDADGGVTGVTVATPSAFSELDDAAVKCITNGWRFKPAMQNGTPIAGSKQYKIVWKLTG
ncbi:MAG: TonB family protein [Proteobacteria bacterium]|nr:TonB family protein [Pseudomonadota bacterium]